MCVCVCVCICVCVCVCVHADFLPSLSCIILETRPKVKNFAAFFLVFFCETSHSWDSLDLIVLIHSVGKGGSWTWENEGEKAHHLVFHTPSHHEVSQQAG